MVGQAGGAEWQNILAAAQAMVQRHQGQLADEIKTSDRPSAQLPTQPHPPSSYQPPEISLSSFSSPPPSL